MPKLARLAMSAATLTALVGLRWLSRRCVDTALALATMDSIHRR